MKATETHGMKDQELTEEVGRLRTRLFELRTQAVTQKLENPRQIRDIRRDIARIKTELRQREIQRQGAGA